MLTRILSAVFAFFRYSTSLHQLTNSPAAAAKLLRFQLRGPSWQAPVGFSRSAERLYGFLRWPGSPVEPAYSRPPM